MGNGNTGTPGGGQPGASGPPAEAVTACVGLTEGSACSFTANGNERNGTCRTPPGQSELACMPNR